MILVLSKPYNPGDTDPGKTYTHLHIESLVYNAEAYVVNVAYSLGTLDDNQYFVKGAAATHKMIQTTPDELKTFSQQMCNAGEPALIGSERLAYQMLIDDYDYAGSIDMVLPYDPVFFPNPKNAPSTATSTASSSSSSSTAAPSSSTSSNSSNTSSNTGLTP